MTQAPSDDPNRPLNIQHEIQRLRIDVDALRHALDHQSRQFAPYYESLGSSAQQAQSHARAAQLSAEGAKSLLGKVSDASQQIKTMLDHVLQLQSEANLAVGKVRTVREELVARLNTQAKEFHDKVLNVTPLALQWEGERRRSMILACVGGIGFLAFAGVVAYFLLDRVAAQATVTGSDPMPSVLLLLPLLALGGLAFWFLRLLYTLSLCHATEAGNHW